MPTNESRKIFTVGDLFSGIGGFSLGLERAGMQVVWQSEIEPYCCKVLKKHWPKVPNLGDIFKIKDPPPVDIITAGVPCQPASCAGKRRGTEDDRWLWPDTLRIIHEVKPTWCILENVCGILSLEGGLVFENLLLALEAEGYEVQPFVIPACALNAPHRRDRIWIVANYGNGLSRSGCFSGKKHSPSLERGKETKIPSIIGGSDRHAPDTEHLRELQSEGKQRNEWRRSGDPDWNIPWPKVAARLCRISDGLPAWVHRHRVKRLKALGNSIVPQIAEEIGRMILEIDSKVERG